MSGGEGQTVEIVLEDERDRWRWVCPSPGEHRSWEPTNSHFWCAACANAGPDVDPEFDELRNKVTGEVVPRERIRLIAVPSDRPQVKPTP